MPATIPAPPATIPGLENDRQPILFTATTWGDLPGGRVDHDTLRRPTSPLYSGGWQDLHDLAVELFAFRPELDFATARLLVDAASSGCPVVLTYRTLLHGGTLETTTATVIVDEVVFYRGTPNACSLRIRYWGFAHPVPLSDVVAVDLPETTRVHAKVEA